MIFLRLSEDLPQEKDVGVGGADELRLHVCFHGSAQSGEELPYLVTGERRFHQTTVHSVLRGGREGGGEGEREGGRGGGRGGGREGGRERGGEGGREGGREGGKEGGREEREENVTMLSFT